MATARIARIGAVVAAVVMVSACTSGSGAVSAHHDGSCDRDGDDFDEREQHLRDCGPGVVGCGRTGGPVCGLDGCLVSDLVRSD